MVTKAGETKAGETKTGTTKGKTDTKEDKKGDKNKQIKKVNYDKVSKMIDRYFTDTSMTIANLSNHFKISKTSVSKIKYQLEMKWAPRDEETALPNKYFKKNVEGYVIKKMFDMGWIKK